MHSQQLLLLLLLMALLCPSSQIEIGMHLTVSHLRASDILRASVLTATKKKKNIAINMWQIMLAVFVAIAPLTTDVRGKQLLSQVNRPDASDVEEQRSLPHPCSY